MTESRPNDRAKVRDGTIDLDGLPFRYRRFAEVAALIPNARHVTIDGAGHLVHATKPDEFVALVCEFPL